MKVTPRKKKFGKYAPGDVFDFPDRAAKVLIKVGKLERADESKAIDSASYQTRMMAAQPSAKPDSAPYGYKADGTPRARPGRPAKAE